MRTHRKYLAVAFLLSAVFVVRSDDAKTEKIIIDTDAGADDAVAILMILTAETNTTRKNPLQTIAITCTYGNTYLENVEKNVLKILTIANRSDIPVYAGASKSLLNNFTAGTYFGRDGLGDFEFNEPINGKIDRTKHAAVALVDLVKQNPGKITLLSLGPSTNVATAIALEPSFRKYLNRHVVLGASVLGNGNFRPNVEFNFGQDPESNSMVMNSESLKPTVLFPWETAIGDKASLEWRENVLGKKNSRIVNFLNKAEKVFLEKSTSWDVSDAFAAAVVIWPELVKKSTVTHVSPVTDGSARGSVLVDYANKTGDAGNALIVQKFDKPAFQDLLLQLFS